MIDWWGQGPEAEMLATAILFGGVGFACLRWPDRIQRWAIKSNRGWAGKVNPFRSFLGTEGHRVSIRVTGFIAVAGALFAVIRLAFRLFDY
jgi:hypothetical protein